MQRAFDSFLIIILSVALCCAALGFDAIHVLAFGNIQWLLQGDWAFALFTWNSFLSAPWQWPLGSFFGYLYPTPINLVLGDAVPWWSVVWKAILGPQKTMVQITGLWLWFCFTLQALCSFRLTRLLYPSRLNLWLVTIALAFAPFLTFRLAHPALCAHFIVLLAMEIVLRKARGQFNRAFFWMLLLLGFAAGIHPYFVPMLMIIGSSLPFVHAHGVGWRRKIAQLAMLWMGSIALLLGIYCVLGLLGSPQPAVQGIHFWTADVFTFWNSLGRAYVPQLWKARMGQSEGFSYLGLGWLIMLTVFISLIIRRKLALGSVLKQPSYGPLLISCLLLFIWSWGEHVRFFGQWLTSLHFLYSPFYKIIGPFRSAGRFAWPLAYFCLLFLPKALERHGSPVWRSVWILPLLLLIQLLDISAPIRAQMLDRNGPELIDSRSIESLLDAPLERLDLMPPDLVNTPCRNSALNDSDYIPLAYLAQSLGLAFNSGNRANPPYEAAEAYCRTTQALMERGEWRKESLYVFDASHTGIAMEKLSCLQEGRWRFCRTKN